MITGTSTHVLVRRVTLHHHGPSYVVEVDGELDLVSGYDLRQAYARAMRTATQALTLDLSRVTAVDDQGLASLEWCCAHAEEAHRLLEWTASNPSIRDLMSRLGASPHVSAVA